MLLLSSQDLLKEMHEGFSQGQIHKAFNFCPQVGCILNAVEDAVPLLI